MLHVYVESMTPSINLIFQGATAQKEDFKTRMNEQKRAGASLILNQLTAPHYDNSAVVASSSISAEQSKVPQSPHANVQPKQHQT